jgi:hypothetical protein
VKKRTDTLASRVASLEKEFAALKREIASLRGEGNPRRRRSSSDYYMFVQRLRTKLRDETYRIGSPTIRVGERCFGIDTRGLIYDKETGKPLRKEEAFRIYRLLYEHHRTKETS